MTLKTQRRKNCLNSRTLPGHPRVSPRTPEPSVDCWTPTQANPRSACRRRPCRTEPCKRLSRRAACQPVVRRRPSAPGWPGRSAQRAQLPRHPSRRPKRRPRLNELWARARRAPLLLPRPPTWLSLQRRSISLRLARPILDQEVSGQATRSIGARCYTS